MTQDAAFRDWYISRVRHIRPITPRQAEAIYLVRCGLSNERIAELMGICVNTVKAHLQAVYRSLDVGSKAELVAEIDDTLGLNGETDHESEDRPPRAKNSSD